MSVVEAKVTQVTQDTHDAHDTHEAKADHSGSEPKKAAALVTAHVANDIYPHLYPGLLPVILMPQLGFSIAAAGMISTVIALTTQLLQPVMGL